MTQKKQVGERKLLEKYTIYSDKVPAIVHLWDIPDEMVPLYQISLPIIGEATTAVLNTLIHELAKTVPVDVESITDTEQSAKLKDEFYHKTFSLIKKRLPSVDDDKASVFAGLLVHKMYGLGDVELILSDDFLEEVVINGVKQPVSVYHRKHGWCKTTMDLKSEEDIYNLSSQIGRKVGTEITSLNPVMDAHLLSGDRVASTLFPISTAGNTITIRRFARTPWTVTHFCSPKFNTFSKEVAAVVWQAMQFELNVLVAGGTASGKTSFLNTLCSFIPPKQRVISIEDTRELQLPKPLHWNWVPMSSRNKNPEGQGEVTMLDLIVASLRMRPDRIVVGEIRRREQAEALFEAMHTGHSVYATMHADNAEQVKRRLLEPPIEIPAAEVESLHLVVIQYRDRRQGLRRTLELAEILQGNDSLELNYLYRWVPRTDTFEKVSESIRLLEDINLHTGMTVKEINNDLLEKQNVLQWMIKNQVTDIHKVGEVMQLYYKTPEFLLKSIKNKLKPDSIIK
jgi:archaeal flagellar protein FlaI